MTIAELTKSIRSKGIKAYYVNMTPNGEVRMKLADADRKNSVILLVPYRSLDDPGLPDYLIGLWLAELEYRRKGKMKKKGT